MIDNTLMLKDLLAQGKIRLRDSQILHQSPPPLPKSLAFQKVEGMLLGLAIGDALGATSEGKQPAERQELYGEIRDYLPGQLDYRHAGWGTDDTQLSFFTVEQLIQDNGLNPDNLANKFCGSEIWGAGGTVKGAISNYKERHIPWYEAGLDSRGNGALMRIAPVILPYLHNPHPSLYADAALATMITHNSFANTASCVAFVNILWDLLGMTSAPEPSWWLDRFCYIAEQLEGITQYNPCNPRHADYKGSLWRFTHDRCGEALRKGLGTKEACDWWGSGADLFETVPSVLYILATRAHNAEEAIIRAVNDTKDNDSIGAIVGAAVGALHGLGSLPDRWLKNLTGIIRKGETGEVWRLLLRAKRVFWLKDENRGEHLSNS